MKALASTLLVPIVLAVAWSSSSACPDIVFGGDSTGVYALAASRDACWSGPPDMEGYAISSERVDYLGLESEVCDDLMLDQSGEITLARWWGVFWCSGPPFGGIIPYFTLRFFEDDECRPGALLQEIIIAGECNQTHVYTQELGYWVHQYEAEISVPLIGGQTYWFMAQAGDHIFQPQWGRLLAATSVGCEGMFRSEFFGYPDWVPLRQVIGLADPYDAAAEFECAEPTTAMTTSWGEIRTLYR